MNFAERTSRHLARVAFGVIAVTAAACGSDDPVGPVVTSYSVSAPVQVYDFGLAQDLQITQGLGLDINDAGMVVGGRPSGVSGSVGFTWTSAGGVKELVVPGGGTWTAAFAVSGSGQIAGASYASGGRLPVAYLRTADGLFRTVGPGTFSLANAVNDAGVVGGHAGVDGRLRAFRWSAAAGPVLLRDSGGTSSSVRGMNGRGDAVGMFNIPGDSPQRAAFWNAAGQLRELPRLPGGRYASAQAVNDAGLVVGVATTAAAGDQSHAVVWFPDGRMQDLGTLPGGSTSVAVGVNELGEVVGSSLVGVELRAYFWTAETGMIELPGLPGAKYTQAERINEKGQIVGYSGGSVVLWQVTRPTR